MADRTGQHLGNYLLGKLIGQGGFADVYVGEHIYLQKKVAIKILNTQLTPQDQASFRNEAKTIAHLEHTNIVRVRDFDIDKHENIPFMVMDYAANGTLREKHPPQTRLNSDTIVLYVQQLTAALQYIHNENLIHLDIKPENMLIGNDGKILLSDFGIAITVQQKPLQVVEGTVYYMAPEQIRHNPVAASDQYSLATVVYEWLCGSYLFDGTTKQIVTQHLTAPPLSLRLIDARISPAIESVVFKALSKNPLDRYATILEFSRAFEQACNGTPIVNSPKPILATPSPATNTVPIKPHPVQPAIQRLPSSNTRPVKLPPPPIKTGKIYAKTPLTIQKKPGDLIYIKEDHMHYVQTVSWSPDALSIATGSADQEVRIRDASSGNSILIYKEHNNEVCSVTWSPDSTALASAGIDQLVHIWDPATGKLKYIYPDTMSRTVWGQSMVVTWAPKGPCIASATDRTVQIWDVNSGTTLLTYPGHKEAINAIAWSADGQRIASASDDKTVHVWEIAQCTIRCTYTKHSRIFNALAWAPDNKRIASGSSDTNLHVWDADQGDGAPIRIFIGHLKPIYTVAWSPDGRYIASGSGDKTIRVWDVHTGDTVLTYKGHTDRINALAWSPDSRYIASVSDDRTLQVWQTQ